MENLGPTLMRLFLYNFYEAPYFKKRNRAIKICGRCSHHIYYDSKPQID